jgi:hypothetical protein
MLYIPLDNIKIKQTGSDYLIGTVKERRRDTKGELDYLQERELVGSFNGVRSFLNYLKENIPKPPAHYSSSEDGGRSDFQVFKTYQEALDTYLNNPSSLVRFDEIEEVLQSFDEIGKDVEYAITGDFIDIARYMEGIPEVFGSLHNGNVRRYRANITINISWVYSVIPQTVNKRLQKILSLVDWLEINNIRCSITAVSSHQCSHVEINVKDYDETLDLRELATVSHSDFLRRMIFRFSEASDTIDGGYGGAYDFHYFLSGESSKRDDVFEEFNVFVDSYNSKSENYDEEFEILRKQIMSDIEEGVVKDRVILN